MTLALAIAGVLTTPKSCGDDRGLGPILALELATNATEIEALLKTPECKTALRENTWADIVVFIPAFTTFLIAGAFLLGRKGAAAFFAFAAICDWSEDWVMLRLLDETAPGLFSLFWSSRLKFFALSVGIIILGWVARTIARGYGWLMIIGGAIAISGLALDHRLLMPGTLLAWLSLAAFALRPARQRFSRDGAARE